MQGDSRADLDKLTVKELRRQAALKNVPLQQIAVAVEKADLINLIIRAGPVLDTYDAKIGVKVHSASSIAAAVLSKSKKPQKQKKKKRRHSSTSSSSSSSSTRSRSRGRRKKRSRSRRRSRSKEKKRPALPARARSRSPSLTVITPLPGAARIRAARALPPPPGLAAPVAAGKASKAKPLPIADAAVDLEEDAVIPASTTEPPPPDKQHQDKDSAIVQAGVAAAAAMGFKLTKAPAKALAAPALGLRPTVNAAAARAAGPYVDSMLPGAGARVCVEYLTTASCVLGDNCPDAHIIDPEEEMRVRAKFKEQECHSGALCNRPGCLFRHPGELLEKCILATDSSSMSLRISGGTVRMEYK